ncbi:MAG: HYExAFE family protein [Planctomycetota bacterium]
MAVAVAVAVAVAERALQYKYGVAGSKKLQSFDLVVYSESGNNPLIDVKGRKHSGQTGRSLQHWVTRDNVSFLEAWSGIFGEGFESAFVFLLWCDSQPPDALFLAAFEFNRCWDAVLAVWMGDYVGHVRDHPAKWDPADLSAADFDRVSVRIKKLL